MVGWLAGYCAANQRPCNVNEILDTWPTLLVHVYMALCSSRVLWSGCTDDCTKPLCIGSTVYYSTWDVVAA